jgi:putative oxidoreductase
MLSNGLNSLWAARILSILRIMTGLLFLEHGTQKLFGFPPSPSGGPALRSLLGLQGVSSSRAAF